MTQLTFNRKIANDILNDNSLREELIVILNELIDNELSKSDDKIDFDIIDTYTEALYELYEGKGLPAVLWKLQTADEFVKSITKNAKSNKISKIFKITIAACAVMALFTTANYAVENATGQGIATHVAEAVQQIFTGGEVRDKTKLPETTEEKLNSVSSATETTSKESKSDESTTKAPEETTTAKQEQSTTKPQKQETTTAPTVSVTPQNPDLTPVLRPTTPPTQSTTTTTTTEPFTRVDEDVTAAPIVIKLTGTYSASFKKDYLVGEAADFSGLTITATYDNGTTKNISISQCSVSGFSTQTPGNKIVTVKYQGCSFSFLIRVKEV